MDKKINRAKKLIKLFTFLIIVVLVSNSCNKKCDCTNEPCPCFPFTISVYANANNAAEGSFATSEMSDFHLLRTTENYQLIDSIKITFTDLFSSQEYNKVYRFSAETFSNIVDIRPYNFILKNTRLNTSDTISAISYSEQLENVLCNVCSNCEDEYIDCLTFDQIQLELNCEIQNKAEIVILRRAN